MSEKPKYTMTLSLHVLEHLGINLYSNIPAVLSEVVANAYDADADEVKITIGDDKIIIEDDGNGMDLDDINRKFLRVGYKKREDGANGGLSAIYSRPVMGRKGIGKLSLFSIAGKIEIYTIKGKDKNGFRLNRASIKDSITKQTNSQISEAYHPEEIDESLFEISKGTRIEISEFDKNVNKTEHYLRKRIARRFSVIGDNFKVKVNDDYITIQDRDYFNKIQFLWLIGDEPDIYSAKFKNIKKVNVLSGIVKSNHPNEYSDFKISGWIGAVEKPSDLGDKDDDKKISSNNKISIITRGKLAQEDILNSLNESGVFATYLIGEIVADILDDDKQSDIATSSRQSIKEDDIRYLQLLAHLQPLIKDIKRVWTDMRLDLNKQTAISKIEIERPLIFQWFETLKPDSKEKARELFAKIESFHFDDNEAESQKKMLYKQGIIAFEKLKLNDELSKLDRIKTIDDIHLASIFANINDIEANTYYDIAKERVEVIKIFNNKLIDNQKERILQQYLFDNLWLLNPSWERATSGTEIMEQKVKTAFSDVDAKLTQEEKNGRFDIRYRTSGGRHIIIELKRYSPSYKIDSWGLARQASKYYGALKKCLNQNGETNPHIEVIIILGNKLDEDTNDVDARLKTDHARIIYYDELIEQSLQSYSIYLERNKKIGKLKELIDKI